MATTINPSDQTITQNAIQIGAANNLLTGVAIGSTGQFLQANTSAAATWSTATLPSTATGTGTILRADGTNWVATTATYPNTAGTSGNVLTSDGTNWSSTAATAIIQSFSVTLTSAQIKALHATPITLVAAPGANKVILPIQISAKFTYGGSNVFVAGAAQAIYAAYGATGNTWQPVAINSQVTASVTRYNVLPAVAALLQNAVPASYENIALVAYNPVATEISGNAANDNTLELVGIYYIASF